MGYDIKQILGAEKQGKISPLLTNQFEITKYQGVDFVFGEEGRIILWKTFLKGLYDLSAITKSLIKIYSFIKAEKPNVIFNFYEPLVGIMAPFFPNIQFISVGHQYAMTLKEYPKIKGFYIQKVFLRILNYLTTLNSKIIALSYYPIQTDKNLLICPPILRNDTYSFSNENKNYILVYLMNKKMIPKLGLEAIKYPNENIECFTRFDSNEECQKENELAPKNLRFFCLNGELFQSKMKECKAVVCSGGFETASEAILHNKPLLMVPMKNHFEQYSNCNDAFLAGLAETASEIDLFKLINSDFKPSKNINWMKDYKKNVKDFLKKLGL
jgi:uncharacterized protein (TIGR00661 family)